MVCQVLEEGCPVRSPETIYTENLDDEMFPEVLGRATR